VDEVNWYKDGIQLPTDTRFVYISDTVLEIRGVIRADQGMYQCFASDTLEETQGAAQLLLGGNYLLFLCRENDGWISFFLVFSH